MTASVIAVLGTLAGGALTGTLDRLRARAAAAETRHRAQLAAVTALVSALADHRRAMWVREDLRLSGAVAEAVETARDRSHETRSAITVPMTTVAITVPALTTPARHAAEAVYAMRNAHSTEALSARRNEALVASDKLTDAAARLFR